MAIRKYTIYWTALNQGECQEYNPEPLNSLASARPRPAHMYPCVVVSPDELNLHLQTVMVAPLTSSPNSYPWRPSCVVKGKKHQIALDQIRTVAKENLHTAYGRLNKTEIGCMQKKLNEMFW